MVYMYCMWQCNIRWNKKHETGSLVEVKCVEKNILKFLRRSCEKNTQSVFTAFEKLQYR